MFSISQSSSQFSQNSIVRPDWSASGVVWFCALASTVLFRDRVRIMAIIRQVSLDIAFFIRVSFFGFVALLICCTSIRLC